MHNIRYMLHIHRAMPSLPLSLKPSELFSCCSVTYTSSVTVISYRTSLEDPFSKPSVTCSDMLLKSYVYQDVSTGNTPCALHALFGTSASLLCR